MAMYRGLVEIEHQRKETACERMSRDTSFKLDIPDLSGTTVRKTLQAHNILPDTCKCCSHRKEQWICGELTGCEIYIFRSTKHPDAGPKYHVTMYPYEDYTLYDGDIHYQSAQTGTLVLRFCTNTPAILRKEQKRVPIRQLMLTACRGRDEQYDKLFQEISKLPDLHGLVISLKPLDQITGEFAEFLTRIPNLEFLTLDNISPDVLPVLQKMTHLKALRLEYYHPDQEHRTATTDFLNGMDSLEYLELRNCNLDIETLTKPPRLKWLNGKTLK